MADLAVTIECLDSVYTDLTETAAYFGERLAEWDSCVVALRSQWTGEASDAFGDTERQWNQTLANAKTFLADTASAITAAQETYSTADSTVASLWQM